MEWIVKFSEYILNSFAFKIFVFLIFIELGLMIVTKKKIKFSLSRIFGVTLILACSSIFIKECIKYFVGCIH